MHYGVTSGTGTGDGPARTFPSLSHARFRYAESRRPSRPLKTDWHEIFTASFASLGLGLGWAQGVAQTFGVGEAPTSAASVAVLLLLLLASSTAALALPAARNFHRLGSNLDSPVSHKWLALWACTALFAVNTLFVLLFPSAHRFFLALLGLEMLILCPGSLFLLARAHRVEPRPHWKNPTFAAYSVLGGLAVGAMLYAAYGFLLGGTGADLHGHLILAGLCIIGHMLAWHRHLGFLTSVEGDGNERILEPVAAARVRRVGTLTFLGPFPLVIAGLFLPGPWRFVFLLAPLLAASGLLLQRILLYVPENAFPVEFPKRKTRQI